MSVPDDLDRCEYRFADDRRCRSLRFTPEAPFCFPHTQASEREELRHRAAALRQQKAQAAQDALVSAISEGPLESAIGVNELLRRILILKLQGHISARDATAFTQIARLLLKSVPDVFHEHVSPSWQELKAPGDRLMDRVQKLLVAEAEKFRQQREAAEAAKNGKKPEKPVPPNSAVSRSTSPPPTASMGASASSVTPTSLKGGSLES